MKCCDLTSGMLRHKVVIEREVITQDSVGGYSSAWATHKTVYAAIKPTGGSERLHAMRLESNISHKVYLRYTADITPKDRIIYNGREMQIRAVINVEERNKWLELLCSENQVN